MTAFEELLVWQRARVLTTDVYRLVRASGIAQDYAFRDQIQRAVLSIAANIAAKRLQDELAQIGHIQRLV